MKDKLIIIATIQNVLADMTSLMGEPQTKKSPEKLSALMTLGKVLFDMHFAITGNKYSSSPQNLMKWMIKYCKDEADGLDGGPKILRIH
jgi:hypothetical protein